RHPGRRLGQALKVSGHAAPLSVHRRLGPGNTLRAGRIAPYRSVIVQDGEPHVARDDLLGGAPAARSSAVPLLCLAHLTDLQLADVQSPARFEFFNREFADPRFADLIPTQ